MRFPLIALALALLPFACTHKADDSAGLNQAPTATVSLKDVTLSDTANLVSAVHVYWTGSDVDGYVKGFQISINNGPFSPLFNRTDSLFRFSLSNGQVTQNLSFRVIAIDDKDTPSEPAELILPLRNTPPTAIFNPPYLPRLDTALGVLTLPFIASDADGDETLDSVFLRVNEGPWLALPKNTVYVALSPQDPRSLGAQPAIIWGNSTLLGEPVRYSRTLQGLVVGGPNTFEVKARDLAGAESPIDQIRLADGSQKPFYIRPITSDLLVLDAHSGTGTPSPESIYYPTIASVYPRGFDKLDLLYNQGQNQQRLFQASMRILLSNYDKVFWYSDDARSFPAVPPATTGLAVNRSDSLSLLVETISNRLAEFSRQPGKHVLFSSRFPDGAGAISPQSVVYGFLPIDSVIISNNGAVRLGGTATLTSLGFGYPNLRRAGTLLTGVDTFYPGLDCDSTYSAPLTFPTGGPAGYSHIVGGRAPKGSASPRLVFFTMELDKLSGATSTTGPSPEFVDLMSKILTRDFN